MAELVPTVALVLSAVSTALLLFLCLRKVGASSEVITEARNALTAGQERMERKVSEAIAEVRREVSASAAQQRQELSAALHNAHESLVQALCVTSDAQRTQLDVVSARCEELRRATELGLEHMREKLHDTLGRIGGEQMERLERARLELGTASTSIRGEVERRLESLRQQAASDALLARNEIKALVEANVGTGQTLRESVEKNLASLQKDNAERLEQMRLTVDEKLHGTLEKRLGESFQQVSSRLEEVHKGLGEMQTLAADVGSLKNVMSNVRARGSWGEVQLGRLLEDMLTPEQFGKNVATRPGSNERVEFALKLPGGDRHIDQPVWLPIDAKFPREDYLRILEASEKGDAEAVSEASQALALRIKAQAKDIASKYIEPPHTTDFGIMFLPTEGLFAEVIRQEELLDELQRQHRIVVAGPTTLAALLNSIQMGFQTLAIQKRSVEVWKVLAGVKTEFEKFSGVMGKVQKKLQEASNVVDGVHTRTRAMQRRLRAVELPGARAREALGIPETVESELDEEHTDDSALSESSSPS